MIYKIGDATRPPGDGKKIIAHICNNIGKWGKGFVLAVSLHWPKVRTTYLSMFDDKQTPALGTVQIVTASKNIFVANMIAQEGIYPKNGLPPIRYEALYTCLKKLNTFAKEHNATIHMPKIGCGLAGGSWDRVEEIILKTLKDVEVTVWTPEKKE